MRRRLAICSGLQPCTQRRTPRCGLFLAFYVGPRGPTPRPPGPRTTPDSRSCTYSQSRSFATSLATLGRRARRSACHCAIDALYSSRHVRVDALRRSSRETVDGLRCSNRAISRTPRPCARRSAIPRARRTTGTAPIPLKKDRDSRHQRGGTTETPPARTHPPRAPRPRSSAHDRSRPRTRPDPRATPPSAAPAKAPAPGTAEPAAAAPASSPSDTSTIEVLRRPVESALGTLRNTRNGYLVFYP